MSRLAAGLTVVALAPWSAGRLATPPADACSAALDNPAAAYALSELARLVGSLDELCFDGFTDQIEQVALDVSDEAVDPAELAATAVGAGPAVPTTAAASPGEPVGSAASPMPAPPVAGAAALVDAGLVATGPELDALVDATTQFCAAPDAASAAALLSLAGTASDVAVGWSTNRVAVTVVGEQCPDHVGMLVEQTDLLPP
jgi:hypothetical protein